MKDCLRAYFKTKTVAFVYSTVPDNPTVHLENEGNEDKSTPEVKSSHPKDIEIDAKCNQEEENHESKVCLHPTCEQCISSNRTYCSRFHNKCEFLFNARINYTLNGDEVGKYLTTLFLKKSDGKTKNPLQPQLNACDVPNIKEFDNLSALLDFYWPYQDILHAALGKNIDGEDNGAQTDQKIRAQQLANMITDNHTVVRLMDGHCGFLLQFLYQVREIYDEARLNSLTIELVDIVPSITEWHHKLYPCHSLHCLTEPIINIDNPLPDTTLLYMNFCGIAQIWGRVCAYLKEHPTVCLLSFSLARSAMHFERTIIAHTSADDCAWCVEKVKSDRRDYATYIVKLKNI